MRRRRRRRRKRRMRNEEEGSWKEREGEKVYMKWRKRRIDACGIRRLGDARDIKRSILKDASTEQSKSYDSFRKCIIDISL